MYLADIGYLGKKKKKFLKKLLIGGAIAAGAAALAFTPAGPAVLGALKKSGGSILNFFKTNKGMTAAAAQIATNAILGGKQPVPGDLDAYLKSQSSGYSAARQREPVETKIFGLSPTTLVLIAGGGIIAFMLLQQRQQQPMMVTRA